MCNKLQRKVLSMKNQNLDKNYLGKKETNTIREDFKVSFNYICDILFLNLNIEEFVILFL